MINKKGLITEILFILIIGLLILGVAYGYFLITQNKGSSKDYAYTVEKTNFWYKLWLKDDHTTVYCFDDDKFLKIIEDAKARDKKVKVTYQDYFFRGFFCTSDIGSDIGKTIITDIEVLE